MFKNETKRLTNHLMKIHKIKYKHIQYNTIKQL